MPRTKTRNRSGRPRAATRRAREEPAGSIDLSSLTALVGFSVRIAQLRVFEQFHHELWRRHHVHPGAFSVLVAIRANPGARPGALASALMVKRPNMTRLIDDLEKSGLVQRRAQTSDGRGVTLALTREGERMIAQASEEAMRMDLQATRNLSASERAQLIVLLEKLSAQLRALNELDKSGIDSGHVDRHRKLRAQS